MNAPWRWEGLLIAPEAAELSLTAHSPSASPHWEYLIIPPTDTALTPQKRGAGDSLSPGESRARQAENHRDPERNEKEEEKQDMTGR